MASLSHLVFDISLIGLIVQSQDSLGSVTSIQLSIRSSISSICQPAIASVMGAK